MFNRIAIRIPNWVGDAVLSIPFVELTRKYFKKSKIFLVIRKNVKDIFINNPYFDKLIIIDDKKHGIFSAIKTGISLRKYKFDLFFSLPDSFSSALILFLSGSKIRVGYKNEARNFLLNFKLNKPEKVIHRAKKYLNLLYNFLEKNNLKFEKIEKPIAKVFLKKSEILSAKRILKKIKGIKIGINPNANASSRRWFKERFAMLSDKILENFNNTNIIFFGSKNEKEYVDCVVKLIKKPVYNFAGKLTLREYIAILKELDIFITNDTGPMHLANLVGTPVIAIEGAADIRETGMLNPGIKIYINKHLPCSPCVKNKCPFNLECLYAISVNDVFNIVKNLLKSKF